jgi:hypothetical protein
MAPNSTTLSAPTGAFELPPSTAELHQSRKGVSWSATPKETDAEMIEKRKMSITYSIVANLSLITVFKTTLNILQATDPSFILISNVDSAVTLRNAVDAEKNSIADLKIFSGRNFGQQSSLQGLLSRNNADPHIKETNFRILQIGRP